MGWFFVSAGEVSLLVILGSRRRLKMKKTKQKQKMKRKNEFHKYFNLKIL